MVKNNLEVSAVNNLLGSEIFDASVLTWMTIISLFRFVVIVISLYDYNSTVIPYVYWRLQFVTLLNR